MVHLRQKSNYREEIIGLDRTLIKKYHFHNLWSICIHETRMNLSLRYQVPVISALYNSGTNKSFKFLGSYYYDSLQEITLIDTKIQDKIHQKYQFSRLITRQINAKKVDQKGTVFGLFLDVSEHPTWYAGNQNLHQKTFNYFYNADIKHSH